MNYAEHLYAMRDQIADVADTIACDFDGGTEASYLVWTTARALCNERVIRAEIRAESDLLRRIFED